MVFLIAYALFEVPSNYLLKKLKPSVSHPIAFGDWLTQTEMDRFPHANLGSYHNGLGRLAQFLPSNWNSIPAWR